MPWYLDRHDLDGVDAADVAGISADEPVTDIGDLFGTAVQSPLAYARAQMPAGSSYPTPSESCAGKKLEFDSPKELELRGFAEAVRAYATRPGRAAAT